jgi:hypothetical protein
MYERPLGSHSDAGDLYAEMETDYDAEKTAQVEEDAAEARHLRAEEQAELVDELDAAQLAADLDADRAVESDLIAERAAAMSLGLRQLADLITANPHLTKHMEYTLQRILVCVFGRQPVAEFARAGAATRGVRVEKHGSEKWGGVDLFFTDAVYLHVYTDRDNVCERVVVGTREVVKDVQDPEALAAVPVVKTTVVEEIVEWQCRPFLADEIAGGDQ